MNNKLILDIYNKKYLLPLYSGSLAIEGVLKILKLNSNDKVLITNVVCYSILQSILNANLTPIIAIPSNGLTLSKKEIKDIVKKENIKVFIAVHQYGYEQEIVKIKDLIVIEDIAQAWNIVLSDGYVGKYSDYIVTSLGKSKELRNSIGGLIISDVDFINSFDIKKRECRNSNSKLLEYYYPIDIDYKKLIYVGNRNVIRNRKNAKCFKNIFRKYNFIRLVDENNSIPSYHRFLIYISEKYYEDILYILDKCNIKYQKEYKDKLDNINLVKNNKIKVIGSNNSNDKCLLLKTDNNYFSIKKLERELVKYYGS